MTASETARKKIENLHKTISHHEHLYRSNLPLEITDSQFDDLVKQLEMFETEYPEFAQTRAIEADHVPGRPTEPHEIPMLSLYSTTDLLEVGTFVANLQRRLPSDAKSSARLIIMPKLDGMAMSLEYRNGRLYKALTRGRKGEEGSVVTDRVKLFYGVPGAIAYKGRLLVRGEVIYSKNDLVELNKTRGDTPYTVGRSAAAAAVSTHNEVLIRQHPPRFVVFSVIFMDPTDELLTLEDRLRWISDPLGGSDAFITVPTRTVPEIDQASELLTTLITYELQREHFDMELDGAVLAVNNQREAAGLGATARHPNSAIAFKFKQQDAKARLLDLEYEVSRQGNVTIMAIIDPVEIMGKTISRPEIRMYRWAVEHRPARGDILTVCLAKDIVPEIKGIEHRHEFAPFRLPTHCPSCNTSLELRGSILHCPNKASCLAQRTDRFAHFVSARGLDIKGLGEKRIETLVTRGILSRYGDLFRLNSHTLAVALGVAPDVALQIHRTIHRAKETTFVRLIVALGIPNIGNATAKQLGRVFHSDLLAIRDASPELLAQVPGIGRLLANETAEWFRSNWDEVQDLLDMGVSWNLANSRTSLPLTGQVLLMTGRMDLPRATLREHYQSLGAEVVDSYSKSITALIAGDSPSSEKFRRAQADAVSIFTLDEFARQFQLTTPQGN